MADHRSSQAKPSQAIFDLFHAECNTNPFIFKINKHVSPLLQQLNDNLLHTTVFARIKTEIDL